MSEIISVPFFLENAGELRFIALEREKSPPTTPISHMGAKYESRSPHTKINLERQEKGPDQAKKPEDYNTAAKPRPTNFLAPAKHQRLFSSLRFLMMMLAEGDRPSKTHEFLCFQIILATKIIKELTPFLNYFFTLFITLRHQSAKLRSSWLGIQSPKFKRANTLNQTCLATTQETRMC
jgi:hypothetical protein